MKSFPRNCQKNTQIRYSQHSPAPAWKAYRRIGPMWLLLLWVVLCVPAFAQRNTGTIVGLVTDSTGAAIPNAAITVTNVETGVIRTEVSEKTGDYRVVSLPPGRYKVAVSVAGFATEVHEGVDLQVDMDARVDFAMKVGKVAESVIVTSGAPLINTENGELGTTLESQQIEDMPNYGREILATLPLLSPGVGQGRQTYDNNPPFRFSINGGRALSSDMLVDGTEAIQPNDNAWNFYQPKEEEVGEMKFQTNAYAAENGRGSASVNIITKSGTNHFHGSAYDFTQNTDLNANDWFNKRNQSEAGLPNVRSTDQDNLYGGAVGGPVLKNRLFFFVDYERHPSHTKNNSSSASVPCTAATTNCSNFVGGDFSALLSLPTPIVIYDPATTTVNPAYNSALPASATNAPYLRTPFPGNIIPADRISSIATNVLKFLPSPNRTDPNNDPKQDAAFNNDFVNTTLSTTDIWHLSPRVDYAINQKQNIFFRLTHDHDTAVGGGVFAAGNPIDNGQGTTAQPDYVTTFGYTYVINDHLVNDFRQGIFRVVTATSYPGTNKNYASQLGVPNSNAENFPIFSFGVDQAGYGGGPSNALNQWQLTNEWADSVTYIKGRHAFKFGGDLRFNQVNKQAGRAAPSGSFGFSGLFTSEDTWNTTSSVPVASMADFLLGYVAGYTIQPADFIWGARKHETAWYVQDDWKISPKLTLNFGLRQDLEFTWKEVNDRYAMFSPTTINPVSNTPGAIGYNVAKTNGTQLWNFAPRVGFSWAPFNDSKTVVRGGAGKFITPGSTIQDYGDTGEGQEVGYSASANTSVSTSSPTVPAFFLQNGGPVPVVAAQDPGATAIAPSSSLVGTGTFPLYIPTGEKTPVAYSWSLSIARELPGHTSVELSYVGTRGSHLPFERLINQVPIGAAAAQGGTSIDWQLMPYPQYGQTVPGASGYKYPGMFHDGNSLFNSLQLKVEERLNKNLNWTFGYTLAKSMDNSSEDPTISWGGATWGGSGVQDIYNLRANWARSSFDQRQKMSSSLQYQLPIGYGQKFLNKGIVGRAIGGWQLNAMMQAHTGQSIEFTNPVSLSDTGTDIQRPNCVAGQSFRSGVSAEAATHTGVSYWNANAFAADMTPNTFGNCGRDLSSVPGYQEVDMSAFKSISFKTPMNENTLLQFRMEAFNALNSVNFGLPGQTVTNPLSPASSGFGYVTGDVGFPRQITAALKLVF